MKIKQLEKIMYCPFCGMDNAFMCMDRLTKVFWYYECKYCHKAGTFKVERETSA